MSTAQFPVELKHTRHRYGGKIVRIVGIDHDKENPKGGRSRDVWYFVGDVEWDDGKIGKGHDIAPGYVCCDDKGRPEVDALMHALNEYLLVRGEWCDKGPHEGWYAHRPRQSKNKETA